MLFGDKIKNEIKKRSEINPLWDYDLLETTAHNSLAAYTNTINAGNQEYLKALVTTQYAEYVEAMLAYMRANGLSVKSERKIWRFKITKISNLINRKSLISYQF